MTHNYSKNGTYKVKLRVYNDFGSSDIVSASATVTNVSTPYIATINFRKIDYLTYEFDSIDPNNSDTNNYIYKWSFDGSRLYETSSQKITYTFLYPGSLNIALTVWTKDGKYVGQTSKYLVAKTSDTFKFTICVVPGANDFGLTTTIDYPLKQLSTSISEIAVLKGEAACSCREITLPSYDEVIYPGQENKGLKIYFNGYVVLDNGYKNYFLRTDNPQANGVSFGNEIRLYVQPDFMYAYNIMNEGLGMMRCGL